MIFVWVVRQELINRLKNSYQDRLSIPHADIDGTLSSLSSFITQYASAEYESSMVQYNKKASTTRAILAKLSPYEDQLVRLTELIAPVFSKIESLGFTKFRQFLGRYLLGRE